MPVTIPTFIENDRLGHYHKLKKIVTWESTNKEPTRCILNLVYIQSKGACKVVGGNVKTIFPNKIESSVMAFNAEKPFERILKEFETIVFTTREFKQIKPYEIKGNLTESQIERLIGQVKGVIYDRTRP